MAEVRIEAMIGDVTLACRLLAIGLHPQAVSALSRLPVYQVKRLRNLYGQEARSGPSRFVQSLARYTPEVGLSSLFLARVEEAVELPCIRPGTCRGCRIGPAHRDFCRHRFPDLYLAYVRLVLANARLVDHLARHRDARDLQPLSATSCYHLYVGYRSGQLQPMQCQSCTARYFYVPEVNRLLSCPSCGHRHPQGYLHRVARSRGAPRTRTVEPTPSGPER